LYSLSFGNFSVGHCILCPFVTFSLVIVLYVILYLFRWSLYCMSFCIFSVGHNQRKRYKRTDNTMTNEKVTKGQRIQWPTEKLQKDREYNDQRKRYKWHTIQWPTGKVTKGQTIQWPTEKIQNDIQYNVQRKSYKRTENTMTNEKVTKGQRIQWPTEKIQNDIQYNDQRKSYQRTDNTMTIFRWSLYSLSFCNFFVGHCIVCHFVSFPLVIVLSVLLYLFRWSFIVCPFVTFPMVIVFSVPL
jgi:hypothetical protein